MNSLSDARMGSNEPGKSCTVCDKSSGDCFGHEGKILFEVQKFVNGKIREITTPIFNPNLLGTIVKILNCLCDGCHQLRYTRDFLLRNKVLNFTGAKRLNAIVNLGKNNNPGACPKRCERSKVTYHAPHNDVIIIKRIGDAKTGPSISPDEVYERFSKLSDEDIHLLGFPGSSTSVYSTSNPYPLNRPQDLLMFGMKVLPPRQRMPVHTTNGTVETNQLTNGYLKILQAAKELRELTPSMDKSDQRHEDKKISLTLAVKEFHRSPNNGGNNRKRALDDLINGKKGMFRALFNSSRVDYCARTVLGPGPQLAADEIGLPDEWASLLTYPELIFRSVDPTSKIVSNLDEMTILLREGKINTYTRDGNRHTVDSDSRMKAELQIGDIVHRHLRDGDIVGVNRYPTLHKGSFMGMKAVFHKGRNVRLPLPATKPFNADNDGDEMQVHVPQSLAATIELRQLMDIGHCIRSDARGTIQVGLAYDGPEGSYWLTRPSTKISPQQLFDAISRVRTPVNLLDVIKRCQVLNSPINPYYKVEENGKTIWRFQGWFSGRFLVSLLMPSSFSAIVNFSEEGVQKDHDVNGNPITEKRCVVRKGLLEEGTLTSELVGNDKGSLLIALIKQESEETALRLVTDLTFLADWHLDTIGFSLSYNDCIRPDLQPALQEKLNEATKAAEEKIVKLGPRPSTSLEGERWNESVLKIMQEIPTKSLEELLPRFVDTPLMAMINSGAKGKLHNIAHMAGVVGAATVGGKLIPPRFYGRITPFFPKGDLSVGALGFCRGNFGDGLSPSELTYNMIESRANVLRGKNVQDSGYAQRKMGKTTENVRTEYDGSVRNNGVQVVSGTFSELNLNPSETLRRKDDYGSFYTGVDVSNLAFRINMMFGAIPKPKEEKAGPSA